MAGRQSAATERALALIAEGMTAYAAAKQEGLALSTIYRALARARAAPKKTARKRAGRCSSTGRP